MHRLLNTARLLLLAAFVMTAAGQCPAGSSVNVFSVSNFTSPVMADEFGGFPLVDGANVFCIPVTAPLSAIFLSFQIYNDPSFPKSNISNPSFTSTVAKDGVVFASYNPAIFGGGTITAINYDPGLQIPPSNAGPPSGAQQPTIYYVFTITAANINPSYNYTALFRPQVQTIDWKNSQNKEFSYVDGMWPGTILTAPLAVAEGTATSFKYKITIPAVTTNITVSYCFAATGPGCVVLNDTCNSAGIPSFIVSPARDTIQATVPLPSGNLPGSNCPANAITVNVIPSSRTGNFYPGLTGSYQIQNTDNDDDDSDETCLSSGALAGIIVGVAIGTAILTALITTFYFHHSPKSGYESLSSPKTV